MFLLVAAAVGGFARFDSFVIFFVLKCFSGGATSWTRNVPEANPACYEPKVTVSPGCDSTGLSTLYMLHSFTNESVKSKPAHAVMLHEGEHDGSTY